MQHVASTSHLSNHQHYTHVQPRSVIMLLPIYPSYLDITHLHTTGLRHNITFSFYFILVYFIFFNIFIYGIYFQFKNIMLQNLVIFYYLLPMSLASDVGVAEHVQAFRMPIEMAGHILRIQALCIRQNFTYM